MSNEKKEIKNEINELKNNELEVYNDLKEKMREELLEELKNEMVEKNTSINIGNKIDRNKMVKIRNVTNGTLAWGSPKTNAEFILEGFGTSEWIEVSELITMKSRHPRILTEPWIIIEDDMEVVEFLGLKKVYDKILSVDELQSFFKKSIKDMENALNVIPNGLKTLIASRALQMVVSEELTDTRKIKLLERTLKIKLLENI